MKADEYQRFTPTTFMYNPENNMEIDLHHCAFGVLAEAGEVAAVYQKFYRGDFDEEELLLRLQKELGGLMYYTAMLCNIENLSLAEIMESNKKILESRKERGVIQGDGDNR
jgi:NTP pyrophosphatase (non-canonical NTP hydrolase)